MTIFFIFFISQNVFVYALKDKLYKRESAISLFCKTGAQWLGMSNTSCAVVAIVESIYNYGFVVQDETYQVCRATGTLAEVEVLEMLISPPLYVEGRLHWPKCIKSAQARIACQDVGCSQDSMPRYFNSEQTWCNYYNENLVTFCFAIAMKKCIDNTDDKNDGSQMWPHDLLLMLFCRWH